MKGGEIVGTVSLAVDDQVVAVGGVGKKVFQVEDVRFLGGRLTGKVAGGLVGKSKPQNGDGVYFGGERDYGLSGANGANQRRTDQFTGFDPGLLNTFDLLEGKGDSGDGGENSNDGQKNGENGFDGNAPKLVVFEFGLLSALEGVELTEGKVIAVVFGAGIDGDASGDDGVGDGHQCFLTNRTNNGWIGGESVFGGNRVNVLGGDLGEEVGDKGRKKVAAAIEAFINERLLVVGGDDFLFGQGLATLWTKHKIILAQM